MDQTQDISNKISQFVASSPTKTVLGVHLGSMLRISFPNFEPLEHQARNLRHFIRMYVPDVLEKGRSGQDVLYISKNVAVVPAQTASGQAPQSPVVSMNDLGPELVALPTTGYNWKAYSNPSYPFVIAANRATGQLQIIPENREVAAPWVIVPKPRGDSHREIASDFVSTLQEPLKTVLTRLLSDQKWYVLFFDVTKRNGVQEQWSAFKRAKLISRFNAALRDLGIPARPHQSRQVGAPASRLPSHETIGTQPIPSNDEAALRNLVQRVIGELPVSELRELRLPVGVVFDALRR